MPTRRPRPDDTPSRVRATFHTHYCRDCGRTWWCAQPRCLEDRRGEVSRECPTCYLEHLAAGGDETERGG